MTPPRGPKIAITLMPPEPQAIRRREHGDQKQIPNLCSSLASINALAAQCAGYLEGQQTRYYVYPETESSITVASPYTTLAQVLSQKSPVQFSRKSRYQIVFIIASSFVQLKGTPWLPITLHKTTLEFPQNTIPGAEPTLDIAHPSIARGFDLSASPTQPNRPDMNAIRTLGVVLIELCFGRPIEGHPLRMNHAEGGDDRVAAALDLAAAVTWLSDVQGEAGSDYADAVAWCLTGCGTAATQRAWRQEMLRNVVVPLERCCQCLV